MRVYIAGISGERQYVKSLRTFYEIVTRPGDYKQERAIGRGDVARIQACDEFLAGPWDAILYLDLDMLFPPDLLERLRAHDLDMVSGHYYGRNHRFIHSICWEIGDGKWPYPPMVDVPTEGLHEIAVTGMGCVLIKRHVAEAVAKRLPPGDSPMAIGQWPPATGDQRFLGTDFRFFEIARSLGFKLFLDASIECKHGTVMWLGRKMADRLMRSDRHQERLNAIADQMFEEGGMDKKALGLRIKALEKHLEDLDQQKAQFTQSLDLVTRQIIATEAVIRDEKWLVEQLDAGQGQPIEERFPIAPEEEREMLLEKRTGLEDATDEEARQARDYQMRKEAQGFVDDIKTIRGQ